MIKDFLAPLKYCFGNVPWRYSGLIFSPKSSLEKMRVIENGFQIDAGLKRRMARTVDRRYALRDPRLWIHVGANDELFGLDEHRQGLPRYEEGYLPILQVEYEVDGVTYEEVVFVHTLLVRPSSTFMNPATVAAYVRLTAKTGPGQVAFEVHAPQFGGGWGEGLTGLRDHQYRDYANDIVAWFSPGGDYDSKKNLVGFKLAKGESAYVIFPYRPQPSGTVLEAVRPAFE